MNVHHVGFLTSNLEKTKSSFLALGFQTVTEPVFDEYRKVTIVFLENGGYCVELVEPSDETSPVHPLLKRFKNTPYHFCYETRDIRKTIADLQEEGYTLTQEPAPAPAINDCLVAFLMKGDIGLIELVQV